MQPEESGRGPWPRPALEADELGRRLARIEAKLDRLQHDHDEARQMVSTGLRRARMALALLRKVL